MAVKKTTKKFFFLVLFIIFAISSGEILSGCVNPVIHNIQKWLIFVVGVWSILGFILLYLEPEK